MKKKLILFASVIFFASGFNTAYAKSGYEFYFFGINVNHLKDARPLMLVAGALASVAAHEAGHLLYLESQGKRWDTQASMSSGFAVQSQEGLNNEQLQLFGRSGFLLQTGIGTLLTLFPGTKNSDFTKGWVAMNSFQIWSDDARAHDIGNDFELIDKGNGESDVDRVVMSLWSQYNLRVLKTAEPGYTYPPRVSSEVPAFSEGTLDVLEFPAPWGRDILPASFTNSP
ncbi:hypothetical protein D3OALGA1CA_2511 [Olavius algarvensis associated proteobacterium Delta 3]|nr:hypothetical protein D3OALGA1CA_2511 [Olavius algarvensis associated proteobacterium Delta 3]